jgi:hypothetical protein
VPDLFAIPAVEQQTRVQIVAVRSHVAAKSRDNKKA